jgi:Protein of unknown function (DUF1579)
MQMPKPDANHEKLHAMVGTWDGKEKMYPSPADPEGGESAGVVRAEMGLDGFFLISNYEQKRGEAVVFKGHGVYGYDSVAKKYTMHWFDTIGSDFGAPAMGDWDGDTLTFVHKSHYGHGRYTYEFIADGDYTFKMESSQDGEKWATIMDGTFRRR